MERYSYIREGSRLLILKLNVNVVPLCRSQVGCSGYKNTSSAFYRARNWLYIRRFLAGHDLRMPDRLVYGTEHCKPGAAEALLVELHRMLADRPPSKIDGAPQQRPLDMTDHAYQV